MRRTHLLFALLAFLSAASVAYMRVPVPWTVGCACQVCIGLLLVLLYLVDRA